MEELSPLRIMFIAGVIMLVIKWIGRHINKQGNSQYLDEMYEKSRKDWIDDKTKRAKDKTNILR